MPPFDLAWHTASAPEPVQAWQDVPAPVPDAAEKERDACLAAARDYYAGWCG